MCLLVDSVFLCGFTASIDMITQTTAYESYEDPNSEKCKHLRYVKTSETNKLTNSYSLTH
jgi:hypothetical protein